MKNLLVTLALVLLALNSAAGGKPASPYLEPVARDGNGSADWQGAKGKTSTPASSGTASKPARAKAPASVEKKEPEALIWAGQSGGFEIRWTTVDLQAWPLKKPGRLVFSAAQWSRRGFQRFIAPPNLDGSEKQVTYERKFALLFRTAFLVHPF